jgi:hypothetical protein
MWFWYLFREKKIVAEKVWKREISFLWKREICFSSTYVKMNIKRSHTSCNKDTFYLTCFGVFYQKKHTARLKKTHNVGEVFDLIMIAWQRKSTSWREFLFFCGCKRNIHLNSWKTFFWRLPKQKKSTLYIFQVRYNHYILLLTRVYWMIYTCRGPGFLASYVFVGFSPIPPLSLQ